MSAQQTIYERIKEDLKGDKILQNVILERLWYYLEPIKDITGGGASITNGTADPTGGADGDYYIQTTVANQIWYNNLGTWSIILSLNPVSVEQSEAGNMEAGIPFYPFYGQIYKITNLGITGIDHILSTGVKNPSNALLFDRDCKAWVTSLDRYVTCTYDVATNKINAEYVLWAAYLSQLSSNAPFIEHLVTNISGETPTLNYLTTGDYTIAFTLGQLITLFNCVTITQSYFDGNQQYIINGRALDLNTFSLQITKSGSLCDDAMFKNYIEIKINLHN